MMNIRCLLLLVLIMTGASIAAQEKSDSGQSKGHVTIERDARLDTLLKRSVKLNKEKEGFDGYRIQLMASSQRQQVHRTKANFRASDAVPGLAQYIVYQPPYFKLRVGNFRDRLEAHRHLQKIKAVPSFNDAFIVQDRIQIEHDQ